MADIIDGRTSARQLDDQTQAEVDAMVAAGQPRPGLTVILVGDDGASQVYAEMAELGVVLRSSEPKGVAEEAAFAYKDIESVMAASASLVRPASSACLASPSAAASAPRPM